MDTRLISTIAALREWRTTIGQDRILGLVPTMGALHAGHGCLIDSARKECDVVVVSLFVNPLQFGPGEDYSAYPRDPREDLIFCRERQVNLLFSPEVREIYPRPQRTYIDVEGVSEHLCGRFRPGHFRGVATIVLKLFNIVRPDRAYFGQKDAQQLALVRRMVLDLNLPIDIVALATVRDENGLALSSRNRRLSQSQRKAAAVLYRALTAASNRVAAGATDPREVQAAALAILRQEPQVFLEYLEVVDPDEMQPVERIAGPVRVAGAIRVGETRLIDSILASGARSPISD